VGDVRNARRPRMTRSNQQFWLAPFFASAIPFAQRLLARANDAVSTVSRYPATAPNAGADIAAGEAAIFVSSIRTKSAVRHACAAFVADSGQRTLSDPIKSEPQCGPGQPALKSGDQHAIQ